MIDVRPPGSKGNLAWSPAGRPARRLLATVSDGGLLMSSTLFGERPGVCRYLELRLHRHAQTAPD